MIENFADELLGRHQDLPSSVPELFSDLGRVVGAHVASTKGAVIGWGDSWLSMGSHDLHDVVQDSGYDTPNSDQLCNWTLWKTVGYMAADARSSMNGDPPTSSYSGLFRRTLIDTLQSGRPLRAILLSGGGNDSTGATLKNLILPYGNTPTVLDPARLKAHIDLLIGHYRDIFAMMVDAWKGHDPVPVIVHGYDYPIPTTGWIGHDWLRDPFQDSGFDLRKPAMQKRAADGMAELIDLFNAGLAGLKTTYPFVHHVPLAGTIRKAYPDDLGEAGWANDLHPTQDAFPLLGKQIVTAIDGLSV